MKTRGYRGYEIRQDKEKRWWVVSSLFEGQTFPTLKDAKEVIREVERFVEECAEELERHPEGRPIVAVKTCPAGRRG